MVRISRKIMCTFHNAYMLAASMLGLKILRKMPYLCLEPEWAHLLVLQGLQDLMNPSPLTLWERPETTQYSG